MLVSLSFTSFAFAEEYAGKDYSFINVGSGSAVDTPIGMGGFKMKHDSNWGYAINISYFTFSDTSSDSLGSTYATEGWGFFNSVGLAHKTSKYIHPYLGVEMSLLTGDKKCTSGDFCSDKKTTDTPFGYMVGAVFPITKHSAAQLFYNSSVGTSSIGLGWDF